MFKTFFLNLQVMSEDRIIMTRAVLLTTYAWHVIQCMKNLYLIIMFLQSTGPNMKHSLAYIPAVSSSTMSHVLYVTWQHVLHKWWYQVVTCVPRDGHASTNDTWWPTGLLTIAQCSLAWMKTLTTHEGRTLILTALYSISLREYVAHFPVNLILQEKSWLAQYAPVNHLSLRQLLRITHVYTYLHYYTNLWRLYAFNPQCT